MTNPFGIELNQITSTPAATAVQKAQLYCTVADMIEDLTPTKGGDESAWMKHIRAASTFIEQAIGPFIPYMETKKFDGSGERRLQLTTPLLEVTDAITNWTTSLISQDWLLMPSDRMWLNGPYTALETAPLAPHMSVWLAFKNGVVIPGLWGMYELNLDTGATVQNDPLADGDTELVVPDGSKLSPGMALLIESEQALVAATGSPTTGVTTLSTAMTNDDETITPANVALVNVGEMIRVDFERMKIVDKNATQWFVLRGYNGSKVTTHAISAGVDVYRTYTLSRGTNGTTAADHAQDTAISRYVPPDDIGLLARTVAALAKKLADSQYAGRTGDAALGQVFYNDIVNRDEFERIRENYRMR